MFINPLDAITKGGEAVKYTTDLLANTGESIKNIGTMAMYITHPGMILLAAWNFTVSISFWLFMFTCLISLILYGLGNKKCAKYVPTSIALYTLISMIASAV